MMKIRLAVLTLFLVIEKSIVGSENTKIIHLLSQVIVRAAMIHLGLWDLAGLS